MPPSAALGRGDGELVGALASGVAEDRGAGKQPPAQRGQFLPLGLAAPALQADAEVVDADGVMARGLGRPERAAAQALQAKLGAEFLDPVFDVGAAVVTAPHPESAHARRQIDPQRLEPVAGQLEQLLSPGVGSFDDALPQDRKADAVVRDLLHLDPRNRGRRPRGVIIPPERAHRRAQCRRQDTHFNPRVASSTIMPWVQKPLSARTEATRTAVSKRAPRIAEERARPADTGGIARPQPKCATCGTSRQRGHDGPMARLQAFAGAAHAHACLLTVFVHEQKRIPIERAVLVPAREVGQRPRMPT